MHLFCRLFRVSHFVHLLIYAVPTTLTLPSSVMHWAMWFRCCLSLTATEKVFRADFHLPWVICKCTSWCLPWCPWYHAKPLHLPWMMDGLALASCCHSCMLCGSAIQVSFLLCSPAWAGHSPSELLVSSRYTEDSLLPFAMLTSGCKLVAAVQRHTVAWTTIQPCYPTIR